MSNLKLSINKIGKLILTCLFLVICTLPLLQMKYQIFSEEGFVGVETKGAFPNFSWASFYQDKFQQEFASWLAVNIGFRPWMVRLDNQVAFTLFNHVNTKYGSGIVLGKEQTLFEQQYVDAYLGKKFKGEASLKKTVDKLVLLKTELDKHQVKLLLLLGGSKASYFPERLPNEYQQQQRTVTNHQRLLELLATTDIPYYDTTNPLLLRKEQAEYPLYPKSGTHWSYFGACFLIEEIVQKLNSLFNQKVPDAYCTKLKVSNVPLGNDSDIAGITNIWNTKVFNDPKLAYPRKIKKLKLSGYRPDIIFIGDSFSWHLLQYLREFRIYKELDFYFYSKARIRHSFPNQDRTSGFFYELPRETVELKSLDFKQEVLSKNLLILQANESSVELVGYDFIDYALSELNKINH